MEEKLSEMNFCRGNKDICQPPACGTDPGWMCLGEGRKSDIELHEEKGLRKT